MKVGFDVNRVVNAYNQNSKAAKAETKKQNKNDKIDISTEGREISKYIEAANNTELKNQRVDEIQKLIQQNKYSVDSSALAKSILKHMKESDSQ